MAQVPDTNTFSLQDVVNVIVPSSDTLQACFNAADANLFDSNYVGNKDRLSNFRNYGAPPQNPPTISMSISGFTASAHDETVTLNSTSVPFNVTPTDDVINAEISIWKDGAEITSLTYTEPLMDAGANYAHTFTLPTAAGYNETYVIKLIV